MSSLYIFYASCCASSNNNGIEENKDFQQGHNGAGIRDDFQKDRTTVTELSDGFFLWREKRWESHVRRQNEVITIYRRSVEVRL